ncbi:MAG TPA: phosphate ABC transporter permease subunit PstC [Nitrospira sp.]|nr:phosphate ABC transporter permease subunit PstC [Nitrospira sp.]
MDKAVAAMQDGISARQPTVAAIGARRKARQRRELVIESGLFLAALVSVAATVTILAILFSESLGFFKTVPLIDFLTDTLWTPLFANPHYGILPLLAGTVVTSMVGLLVAIPLGTVSAIYLSEFASSRTRETIKPVLELLGAVPTIVYGYFALLVVTPALQTLWSDLPGFNMLGPGIVIGIMILPLVISLSEDAMRAVPMVLREGSYAVGATRLQTAWRVVVPAATSGLVAAYVLGVSRAVGETMVVAIAAGQNPNLTWNPMEPAATITAYIVQVALGDLPHGSIGYQSIFAAGLVLAVMTFAFNMLGHIMRKRFREIY